MKPTIVADRENLGKLDKALTAAGFTVVYKNRDEFVAYQEGVARRRAKVDGSSR